MANINSTTDKISMDSIDISSKSDMSQEYILREYGKYLTDNKSLSSLNNWNNFKNIIIIELRNSKIDIILD